LCARILHYTTTCTNIRFQTPLCITWNLIELFVYFDTERVVLYKACTAGHSLANQWIQRNPAESITSHSIIRSRILLCILFPILMVFFQSWNPFISVFTIHLNHFSHDSAVILYLWWKLHRQKFQIQ
jgi:uncharacterized membrane protein